MKYTINKTNYHTFETIEINYYQEVILSRIPIAKRQMLLL